MNYIYIFSNTYSDGFNNIRIGTFKLITTYINKLLTENIYKENDKVTI